MSRARAMEILAEEDRLWASGEARRFAANLGFDPEEQARAAVCVAELASNVAKYARRGRIELAEIDAPHPALRVRAIDEGPGIADVDASVCDGVSEGRLLTPDVPAHERRGLGIGLGAVLRLMDEVQVLPRPGGGLVIEAVLRRVPEGAL